MTSAPSSLQLDEIGHESGGWLDRHAKFVFLGPAMIYMMILGVFPLIFSLIMVFGKWRKGEITWVGLHNIDRMIHEERFWNSMKLTIIFVLSVSIAELILGILVALGLQSMIGRAGKLRLAYTLPMLLPPIAVAYTWRMLFDYNRGPLNYFLVELGFDPVQWLADPKLAFAAIAIVDIWQWTPFIAIGTLAALENQPGELFEAAVLDGARWFQLLKDIALPLLAPYLVALIALRAIDAFKIVDSIFILTGGGPGTSTEFLTFYAYVAGFRPFNLGYTAAIAWSLVIVMTIVFMVLLRLFRRAED